MVGRHLHELVESFLPVPVVARITDDHFSILAFNIEEVYEAGAPPGRKDAEKLVTLQNKLLFAVTVDVDEAGVSGAVVMRHPIGGLSDDNCVPSVAGHCPDPWTRLAVIQWVAVHSTG